MYSTIDDLVRKALKVDGQRGYFEPMPDAEMFDDIFGDYDEETKVGLIRDLLLAYAYGTADREMTVKAICQYAKGNTLDIVELIGEVDELKQKRDENPLR